MDKHENKQTADLSKVFRAMPDLYMLLSPECVVEQITELYASYLHTKAEDVLGCHMLEMLACTSKKECETTRQKLEASITQVLKHKAPHKIPAIQIEALASQRESTGFELNFWEVTHTPILDGKGEISHILHEIDKASEIILPNKEQRHQDEHMALSSGNASTVAWEYDIENDILIWGKSLTDVFGYAIAEMAPNGSSWDRRVHPDDFEAVQKSIAKATASGDKIWTGEYRFKRADGTYAHVLDQGYYIYNEQGKPTRTFGAIIDLTNSRRAEEDLKESDDRFRHLLENLPHMAWTADPKGKMLYFNDNWYSFTGMPKGQTDGRASVIHPDDTADVITTWHHALQSGKLYEIEYRIKDFFSGSYRTFLERGVPMHDSRGNIKFWVGTYTDIEDQRRSTGRLHLKDHHVESILQLLPSYVCLLEGPNHVCRYVSQEVCRMYGNRTYVGRPAIEVWPEFDGTNFKSLLDHVYTKGKTIHLEAISLTKNYLQSYSQEEAFFDLTYQPITSEEGGTRGILISATEVTELIAARREIEEMALKLEQSSRGS